MKVIPACVSRVSSVTIENKIIMTKMLAMREHLFAALMMLYKKTTQKTNPSTPRVKIMVRY
jgi:hypothetical protein